MEDSLGLVGVGSGLFGIGSDLVGLVVCRTNSLQCVMRRRKRLWISVVGILALVAAIAFWPRRDEFQFLYDLGPLRVETVQYNTAALLGEPPGPLTTTRTTFVFPGQKGAAVTSALRSMAVDRKLEIFPDGSGGGAFELNLTDVVIWHLAYSPYTRLAAERGDWIVVVSRHGSWLERQVYAVKRFLHIAE